ncbi:hypothetical protein ACHAXS_003442 [Conticribra weissflogii]
MANLSSVASSSAMAALSREGFANDTSSYNHFVCCHDVSESISVYSGAATEAPDFDERNGVLNEEEKEIGEEIQGEDESTEGVPIKSLDPVLISASSSICSITEQKSKKNKNDVISKPVFKIIDKISMKRNIGSNSGASTDSSGVSQKSSRGVASTQSLVRSMQDVAKSRNSESGSIDFIHSSGFTGKSVEKTLDEDKNAVLGNLTKIFKRAGSRSQVDADTNSIEPRSVTTEKANKDSEGGVIVKKKNASETKAIQDPTKAVSTLLCNPLSVTIEDNETESEVEVFYGEKRVVMGTSVHNASVGPYIHDESTQQIANIKDPESGSNEEYFEQPSSTCAKEIGPLMIVDMESVTVEPKSISGMKNTTSNISVTNTASLTDHSGKSLQQDIPVVYHPPTKPDFFQRFFNCHSDNIVKYPVDHDEENAKSEKPPESKNNGSIAPNEANPSAEEITNMNFSVSANSESFEMKNKEELEHTSSLGAGIHFFNATSNNDDGIEIFKVMISEQRNAVKETVKDNESVDSKKKRESSKKKGIKSILLLKENKSYVFKPFKRGKQPVS